MGTSAITSTQTGDHRWYKEAVIYQLHVKTFFDANGDGIGDFQGLTRKLDYLKDLGVTAIWLLPFYPSPLRDDGYDIADYYTVHPRYGTLKDFKQFLRHAHERDMKVITELVINHTSDQHPWFQRARRAAPGSKYRDFYVWSDTQDKYKDARIIFKDFEMSNWAWDEKAQAYYWHRFYSHQPDLNFDNPAVRDEIFKVVDYWFAMGVDGMRLDAVPYLYEREGTNCENLPETHDFLKRMRSHVDSKFRDRMLLAEANQWPEDAAAYFGQGAGDECHMAFHFPLMPRMYMSVQMEDRFPLLDILEQTPAIPETSQWAVFLRNHDELTLEMVTDDERDYMYRAYASDARSRINLGIRRRLVPLLGNNRRKVELMNILLFSMPGTPVIYYGDEIGMGDNRFLGDRDGVRTPMQWSPDRNAGFSRANPQELYLPVIIDSAYHYETVNVETENANLSSMLWWIKRVIAMRKHFTAFSMGDIRFLRPDNVRVLVFTRRYEDEIILVVINLSRFSQAAQLDLSEYQGYIPEEVFSRNEFPVITDAPYNMTMAPHSHFWFLLKKPQDIAATHPAPRRILLKLENGWTEIFSSRNIRRFEQTVLPEYLSRCRWFAGGARRVTGMTLVDSVSCGTGLDCRLLLVKVTYTAGDPETYVVPVMFMYTRERSDEIRLLDGSIVCDLTVGDRDGILYDAAADKRFHLFLLKLLAGGRKAGERGLRMSGDPEKCVRRVLAGHDIDAISTHAVDGSHNNTIIFYDELFVLKLFRKIEAGMNPDIDVTRYLSCNSTEPVNVPLFAGTIHLQRDGAVSGYLALLHRFVSSQQNAWDYVTAQVTDYFDLAQAELSRKRQQLRDAGQTGDTMLDADEMRPLIGELFMRMVELMGTRTGQMHRALADGRDDPEFAPEPFSMLYQRSLYQSMGAQLRYVMSRLRKRLPSLPDQVRAEAGEILDREHEIDASFKAIVRSKLSACKIRVHGDYRLEQLLFTGKDFVILDFEGEAPRPLSERRLKRSPLRDIAGIIRSFHYAAYSTLFLQRSVMVEDRPVMEAAADYWYREAVNAFIGAYFETIGTSAVLPQDSVQLAVLLKVYMLDKAVYELGYELQSRPDWLAVPLRGIRHVLEYMPPMREEETGDRR